MLLRLCGEEIKQQTRFVSLRVPTIEAHNVGYVVLTARVDSSEHPASRHRARVATRSSDAGELRLLALAMWRAAQGVCRRHHDDDADKLLAQHATSQAPTSEVCRDPNFVLRPSHGGGWQGVRSYRLVRASGGAVATASPNYNMIVGVLSYSMSSSKGEVEPTGTSGKESRKDSTRRSSTATQGWSNHSRSKWFINWCCGDASNPTAQPCGPVIFIDDSRRRRVVGAVLRWEDAKGGRRHFYMQKVYGAKGNVVANSKGTLLDLELCEGFKAGAVNTPFYRELVLGGGFVLVREFFDMLEYKNIALDVPCDVNPSLELSLPLKLCSGCESNGAAAEGGDLGSGPATQLHHGESRGLFDDNEDEGTALPLSVTRRSVLFIPGVHTDAPVERKSTGPAVQVAAYSEVDLEASEGQGVEEVDAGGLGSQGAPQKRRGDRPDEFAGSTKKLKSKAPRTAGEKRKGTEGEQGRQVAKRPFSIQKQPESGPSSPPTTGTHIDVDAGYFLEYKDGVRTKREFDISPAQVWIMRKKKVKNVKPGVAYIHNAKLGRKEVVYNVPVDPPTKKGKKKIEEGEWFVQVPEPDAHCWKTMESLTDNEKCHVLKKVLTCEVVWVQASSPALAKLGKLSVQEVVNLVKCDRVLVRLWNYYQFKHDKRSNADWSQRFPFLKSRSAIFRQFESRGLDVELWDGSTKYVTDSSLFKDCPPYMGCDDDKSIEATEKLAGRKKLSVDWRNKVLSVLTGSRLKSREIAFTEGIVHIKWNDTGDVTSIAPFSNDPLEADIRSAGVKEAVVATKSHTFVLDLCEPVDLKLWKPQAFDTLNSQLQTWCPSHWTLLVFIPRQQNLSFLASMNHLSFVKLLEGKWVRRSQQKKSFPVGNNLYTEDDRMYILFKGDDLRANTFVVYEGKLPAGAATAVRVPQKVTQTDVSDIPFNACVYGDMDRNPAQFVQLLESITKKGEGVVFLGRPHARSVWEVLKAGRHVIMMEGNAELLQFTIDLVKSEVNSGAHNCEFMVVTETRARAWNNKTDMWFKLSARKRNKIYDFLFLQTRPKRDTDAEYVHRKDHMFMLLDNYHGASRMNAKTFLERLQSLYFVESKEELTFGSYSSLISTEDEETTDIEFDATADEEGSDTESLDLQYDQHSAQHGTGSSLAGPSTSPTSLVSPMVKPAPGTTPMKLLQRMQALASGHRSLRLGSDIPPDHLSWTNIHFLPEPQSRSTEADWGHDMIWHPGVIQPAIEKGEWIVAVAVPDGGWMPLPRGSKSDFLDVARIAVLQKVKAKNGSFEPEDVSVISTVGRLFAELQNKCWLELTEDYYDLDTSPSKGRVDWKIPPPSGTHVSTGSRGPEGGENEGDEAGGGKRVPGRQQDGDEGEGGSQGDTMTAEGSGGVAGEALGRQQSTSPGPECSAQSEDVPNSSACSVMAALVALRAGSVETFKSVGIRTSMLAERTERTDAQSWSGPGVANRHPKIDSGEGRDFAACGGSPTASVGARGETAKFAGIRTSSGKACGGPSDRESTKFAGIRISSGKGGQPGILVQAGGAACGGREAHSSGIDTGSGEVATLHAAEEGRVMDKEKEVEEGDTGEEMEEGRNEGEEEEDEGKEGEETELAGLLGGQEGGKGELDTGDDERTFGDDDDRSGESSDGFGQLYGEHREEDEDDDDTALGMETQVVTSLSSECDDYEVQAMTSAVDLQHRFNEARVAVSLTKPSVRSDIEEVIDDILGDHQISTQPSSTPGVEDPLDVKPSGGSVVDFSPTISPMLPPTIAGGGEGGIGERQDVTSPKKTTAGTRALDMLALPAPTSPIQERRDKPAGKQ
ncbi:hypothetical protein CBR_g4279 [Chara braunii]|uniref:Uncharacterized protein n=1 Tax=Chara braunii TaxID=69332 RepID=A0A388JRC4_CHABU|nr:hypothetical protein CBR_g4279 [Chara braunii]|eukprot:GBG60323.1 hypothetical protein CBR_g4279 [Chara braunii]